MGCLECPEIAKAFRGRRWDAVPLETLRYHHEALFLFTDEAYRYFLPAYLTATVKSYKKAGNISHSVVFSLRPRPKDDPELKRFRARMGGFSKTQKVAIRAFLEHMVAEHDEDDPLHDVPRALGRYWARF
jgi:hypothetical protein